MASEIVTGEMVEIGVNEMQRVWYEGQPGDAPSGKTWQHELTKAALLAVAPLIRRAALEEAAAGYDARAAECCRDADACDAAGDADNAEVSYSLASHHSLTAAELRALAEKQP